MTEKNADEEQGVGRFEVAVHGRAARAGSEALLLLEPA
jgi:hypothetical protein